MAYHTQHQPVLMSNQLRPFTRSSPNNFGSWVRNATDKGKHHPFSITRLSIRFFRLERASAMKILQDVLNQPASGYENQGRPPKPVFKQAPAPPPVRASSATRKLGRTRTQHKFPCEVCEKLLIKRHVWDLGG